MAALTPSLSLRQPIHLQTVARSALDTRPCGSWLAQRAPLSATGLTHPFELPPFGLWQL